ncbi:pPIWI-associating nuclease domain-containing protein [Pseudomonas sp. AIG]
MKLKKLLTLDFIQEFESLLETNFEKKLFVASLRNYAAHGNPLRFHNFAFSMRELVLHVIQRKAPPQKVKNATWYVRESDNHEVTRRQQLKYCAQSNLSDAYLGKEVIDHLNECIKEFLSEFHFFNKYTHITEKHFDVSSEKFFLGVRDIIRISRDSLNGLQDLERLVIECLEKKVNNAVVSTAVSAIPESLSQLANHVYIEYTQVEEIACLGIDDEFIHIEASGEVHVTQEYGPKHDLCEINESYPFILCMKSRVSDPEKFVILSEELDVDTSSWYE